MVPADQGFHAGEPAGCEFELRLVVQDELAMLQRFAQLQVELSARLGLLVHRRLVHATAVPAIGLGTVEGHIGVLQQ